MNSSVDSNQLLTLFLFSLFFVLFSFFFLLQRGGNEGETASSATTSTSDVRLLEISVEVLLHILQYVPAESLGRLRRVCKG